jgi:hypothetical protein
MSIEGDVPAQCLGRGDPALANYYPAWLDNTADDATVEDNGFPEEYVAEVRGEPIGCVVLVTRNAAGQTEREVRP